MRDKIKLNSLAVELRRDWDLNPYSPIDLFSIVLSKLPDLTILFYPMSDNTSGMCIKDINGIDLKEFKEANSSKSGSSQDMVICINSNMSKGRQRFTLAHELYHLLFEEEGNLIICEATNDDDSEMQKVTTKVQDWFVNRALGYGWDEATFVSSQCILKNNFSK